MRRLPVPLASPVAVPLALVLLLAACGEQNTVVGPATPATTAAGSTTAGAGPLSATGSAVSGLGGGVGGPGDTIPDAPTPKGTPVATSDVVTHTGQVRRGVEGGCRILVTDQGSFELTGPAARAAAFDTTVRVRGVLADNVVSHCQQGPILRVIEVTRP